MLPTSELNAASAFDFVRPASFATFATRSPLFTGSPFLRHVYLDNLGNGRVIALHDNGSQVKFILTKFSLPARMRNSRGFCIFVSNWFCSGECEHVYCRPFRRSFRHRIAGVLSLHEKGAIVQLRRDRYDQKFCESALSARTIRRNRTLLQRRLNLCARGK
jgi:hypothetical protein